MRQTKEHKDAYIKGTDGLGNAVPIGILTVDVDGSVTFEQTGTIDKKNARETDLHYFKNIIPVSETNLLT